MNDTVPLLTPLGKNATKNRREKVSTICGSNNFLRWCPFFGMMGTDHDYVELNDEDDVQKQNQPRVRFFRLFRFADRLDILLISIALFTIIIYTCCFTINIVLLSRLTSTFTLEPANISLFFYQENISILNQIKNACSWDVELNSFNHDRLHKFCNDDGIVNDHITSLSPLDLSILILRHNTMHILYLILIFGTTEIISRFIQYFTLITAAKRQTTRMRKRLFQSLIQRNISYFDTHAISGANIKLFDNIDSIEKGIGFELSLLIAVLCSIVINTVVSFFINWQLTLILLCIVPLLVGALYLFSKVTTKETNKELNKYSKAGQIVEEVLSSIRTVFSLNGQKFEQNRYERELQTSRWSTVRKGAMLGILAGWMCLQMCIIYFVGFMFGYYLMNYQGCNKINVSSILIVVVLFGDSIVFMSYQSPCFQSVGEACCAAVQVFNLIDEGESSNLNETDIFKDNTSERGSINLNGDIEFINVNFTYPTRKDVSALKNFNLIARAGETTALVGHNGSGKSTCMSLLLRYYETSSGKIMINGQSITDYNIKQLRETIGVVSQESILFNTSIYENIRYGKENATRAEIEEAARQANAHNFIMQLSNKYETVVGERAVQLSGGEKQRITLARILLKQPTILLLDEATSALDNESETLVQEALNQACKNRTTIVIAHHLKTIQNTDRIYVFHNGNIVEQGTHETLIENENGIYKEMINIQQIETIDDDPNGLIIQRNIQIEDDKRISDGFRLFSDTQYDAIQNKKELSSNRQSNFFRLLSMNKPEWISILIGCIMSAFAGASLIILAILLPKTSDVLTNCTNTEQTHKVLLACCLFLIIGIIIVVIRFFQFTAFALSGSNLIERVRAKAFASLLRQEVAYFDQPENTSSAISNRLSSDARAVQEMTGPRLGIICETSILLGIGIILAFVLNYRLALIILIFFTFIIIITYLNMRIKARVTQRSEFFLQQANVLVGDVFDNMRTVKHLTVEKKVFEQYSQLIDQTFIIQRNPIIFGGMATAVVFGTYSYALVAIYWCALSLIEHNQLNTSTMIMIYAFVPFIMQLTQLFWIIIEGGGTFLSGAQYFFDLFDRTPIIDNGSDEGEKLINFRGDIEFDHVKFKYATGSTSSSSVLNNFRLSIKHGQRVALIGTSGCGKSTGIQLLERFYDVTHGQLRFDDVDIRKLNIHWIRSCLSLVSQEPTLFDMTIAENISYPQENIQLEDIIQAATKANIHQFIQQLPMGYETRVGPRGHQLSGGEKQRVAIARALFRRSKVLLLDEATSALDSLNEQIVQQTLQQLQNEDFCQTMIIVSHRLSTIRWCDLICVLKNGRIIESGTHTQLIERRGIYYRMIYQYNL